VIFLDYGVPGCAIGIQSIIDLEEYLERLETTRDGHAVEDVWAVLHYDSPPHEDQMGLHEWLSWMFDTYNTTKHLEITITLWTLWYAHNKLVHEGTHQGVGELVAFICGYCAELAALTTVSLRSNSSAIVKWSLPPSNMVKVNADANGFPFNSLEGDSRAIIKKLVDIFVARSGNRVTHVMARDGLQRGEDRFWVEEAPDSVVLAADEYCC
ncbi:hypothetical protein Gohar_016002, partial [Gossypium harknessii]|nr:hypothetical protein [Gossypium harknessii]